MGDMRNFLLLNKWHNTRGHFKELNIIRRSLILLRTPLNNMYMNYCLQLLILSIYFTQKIYCN